MNRVLPAWVDVLLIPLINLALAFFVSGLVVLAIGQDPIRAMEVLIYGAFGTSYGIGFTLFYATSFVFTGLCVAIAFHAGLFNIGGEGQAGIAGIGVAMVALSLDQTHWSIVFPTAILAAALFGAAWAYIPAFLQAYRGSHIVITTIMFNYIASAVLVYVLVNIFRVEGSMSPETRRFEDGAHLPFMYELVEMLGMKIARTPLNITFFLALVACLLVWFIIWRTRLGYQIRAFGHSEAATRYAGFSPPRIIIVAMLLSGALAGLMALNVTIGGEGKKLTENMVQGAGFVGIAVALMGRSHPFGVLLAAILFGALYQGGSELQFEMGIPIQMVLVIQALVILFTGALENMVRMPIQRMFVAMGAGR